MQGETVKPRLNFITSRETQSNA